MKKQISSFPIQSLAILGVAGGNGLEHIDITKIHTVYGIDINQSYLDICKERYHYLGNHLILQRLDLSQQNNTIPYVDLVIANLLIEYIGIEIFTKQIKHIMPLYVSCVIQKNISCEFVSESPFTKCFTEISNIHSDIDKDVFINEMHNIGMDLVLCNEISLPNKKSFFQLDFKRQKEQ